MMAVWVVVVVLGVAVAAVAVAARHHADDVEPSVREFTEFRDAISRQVAGVHTDTPSSTPSAGPDPVPMLPPKDDATPGPAAPDATPPAAAGLPVAPPSPESGDPADPA